MRILVVSAYGLPHMGGVEVVTDRLARELSARGHELVHVTSTAGVKDVPPVAPGYEVIRVPAANRLEALAGVPYPLFSPRLVSVLRRQLEAADVVHEHGFIYPGSVTATALARRRGGPPLVLTEHVGTVPYDRAVLRATQRSAIAVLGNRVVRSAAAIVTFNDRVREELRGIAPDADFHTILNGVDHDVFRPPATGEREQIRAKLGWDARPRALFVGRPVAKKGFPIAVAATAEAMPDAVLAVAGPRELPPGAPGHVELLGQLSREELAVAYRASDALIAPARGEGFPLTVQEALASGLPVVLGDDPGYAPNLDGAGPAVRIVGDPGDYAAAVRELFGDEEARRVAGAAAADHARRAFSWKQAAVAHETLFEEVVETNRNRAQP